MPLPRVCHPLAIRLHLGTPDECLADRTAAGRIFPLRLGRQPFAGPGTILFRVLIADVHHRVFFQSLQIRVWTGGVPPAGPGHWLPPLIEGIDLFAWFRRTETERSS